MQCKVKSVKKYIFQTFEVPKVDRFRRLKRERGSLLRDVKYLSLPIRNTFTSDT